MLLVPVVGVIAKAVLLSVIISDKRSKDRTFLRAAATHCVAGFVAAIGLFATSTVEMLFGRAELSALPLIFDATFFVPSLLVYVATSAVMLWGACRLLGVRRRALPDAG